MFRCNGIVDNCCCFVCNTPILLHNFTIWKHREKGVLHGMRLQMAGCVPTEIKWRVPLNLSLCLMSWAVWNRKTPVFSHQLTWISGSALCHQCVASHHIHPDEQSRSLKSIPTRKDYILNGRSMDILGNNHRMIYWDLDGIRLQMAGCVPTEIQWRVPLHLSLCLMSWAVWNRKTPVCSHQQTWISGSALCHQCVASHHIHPDEQFRSLKSIPTRKDYILNGRTVAILGNNHRIHILRLGYRSA